MDAQNLEQLAALLNRPVKSLSAFGSLTPEQIGLLGAAIGQASERQRNAVKYALPQPIRWVVLKLKR
ncbi:MAG: hypothetical protein ACRETN_07055 [Nevskiales bacterium]